MPTWHRATTGYTEKDTLVSVKNAIGSAGNDTCIAVSNTYVSVDTNGDRVADFMIGLNGLHTLAATDFIL